MASFDTDLYTAQKPSRSNPSRFAGPNIASGEVEFAVIPYTLDGTETAADTINLGILPADVIPVPALSSVVCSADPGTTLTLDIGTADNPDGWADGIVLSSGGKVECASATMPAWLAATPLVADSATPGSAIVYATVASANTLTADVILYFVLAYKRGRGQ